MSGETDEKTREEIGYNDAPFSKDNERKTVQRIKMTTRVFFSKKNASIGAWKCYFPRPFRKLFQTDNPPDKPTNNGRTCKFTYSNLCISCMHMFLMVHIYVGRYVRSQKRSKRPRGWRAPNRCDGRTKMLGVKGHTKGSEGRSRLYRCSHQKN